MTKQPIKIIVGGAGGRMGRTILALAHRDPALRIAGAFERSDHPVVGRDVGELIGTEPVNVPVHPDLRECVRLGQVVIDFTHPAAVPQHLEIALQARRAMVIGTTGLTKSFRVKLRLAGRKIAIVQAPNMSFGVNLLFQLVSFGRARLDQRYDVEVGEEHHRHKKDAPSGTAIEMANLAAKARQINLARNAVFGRKGLIGERKSGTIGIHAIRGGDTVGRHTILFLADGERLRLTHEASSREAFGYGALIAAKFIVKKKSGLYNMRQVLGL